MSNQPAAGEQAAPPALRRGAGWGDALFCSVEAHTCADGGAGGTGIKRISQSKCFFKIRHFGYR